MFDEVWEGVINWGLIADGNVFLGVCAFVFHEYDASEARKYFTKEYTKRMMILPMFYFFRLDYAYSPICCEFRSEERALQIPSVCYVFCTIVNNDIATWIVKMHAYNFNAAVQLSYKVHTVFETLPLSVEQASCDKRLKLPCEHDIIQAFEQVEGYLYDANGGTKSRAEFRCKQRLRRTATTINTRPSKMKVMDRIRQFHCPGEFYLSQIRRKLTMEIVHNVHHELPMALVRLIEDRVTRIKDLFQQGMAPFQILNVLRAEMGLPLSYATVCNARNRICSSIFKRDPYPLISAGHIVADSISMSPTYKSETPLALCFVTKIGSDMSSSYGITELFIDSTY